MASPGILVGYLGRFPERVRDGLNDYAFPLAILLAKGKKVVLAPIYLGSFYTWLD